MGNRKKELFPFSKVRAKPFKLLALTENKIQCCSPGGSHITSGWNVCSGNVACAPTVTALIRRSLANFLLNKNRFLEIVL